MIHLETLLTKKEKLPRCVIMDELYFPQNQEFLSIDDVLSDRNNDHPEASSSSSQTDSGGGTSGLSSRSDNADDCNRELMVRINACII